MVTAMFKTAILAAALLVGGAAALSFGPPMPPEIAGKIPGPPPPPAKGLMPQDVRPLEAGFRADAVRVEKKLRRIHLLQDGAIRASWPVALGGNPVGHKQQEGDRRTPEGRYVIDWRNPKSSYFLSLHISYPGKADKERARALGVEPGGMIMIHGQPNGTQYAASVLQSFDWTDGCIAVTNEAMQTIWDSVPNGTPIEILP